MCSVGVLQTRTSCAVGTGSHQIVCMIAVYLSAGFPPVLSWYPILICFLYNMQGIIFLASWRSSIGLFESKPDPQDRNTRDLIMFSSYFYAIA